MSKAKTAEEIRQELIDRAGKYLIKEENAFKSVTQCMADFTMQQTNQAVKQEREHIKSFSKCTSTQIYLDKVLNQNNNE